MVDERHQAQARRLALGLGGHGAEGQTVGEHERAGRERRQLPDRVGARVGRRKGEGAIELADPTVHPSAARPATISRS